MSEEVRRVLVATDRSDTAELAVAFAAEMARRYEAELLLLQVIVPGDGLGAPSTASTREGVSFAHEALSVEARERAGSRGQARIVVDDDPAAAIVELCAEEQVDVVVVGNAGMGGRKEFLLGNVPNRVSHNASCTVVIVNSTAPEEEGADVGRLRRFLRKKR